MSDLSDLSDLSDICAAQISRAGKNKRGQYAWGKSSRRTAIPARYDSFSAAPRRARRRYGAGAQPAAAPTNLSGMTGYTKLALRYPSNWLFQIKPLDWLISWAISFLRLNGNAVLFIGTEMLLANVHTSM